MTQLGIRLRGDKDDLVFDNVNVSEALRLEWAGGGASLSFFELESIEVVDPPVPVPQQGMYVAVRVDDGERLGVERVGADGTVVFVPDAPPPCDPAEVVKRTYRRRVKPKETA